MINMFCNKSDIKTIFLLQILVFIYTLSGVIAKFASKHHFFSYKFFLMYLLEIFILFIYALGWQQVIKRIDLSVAYVNRSMALVWSMIWAFFLFGETVKIQNLVGILVVISGMLLVNLDG